MSINETKNENLNINFSWFLFTLYITFDILNFDVNFYYDTFAIKNLVSVNETKNENPDVVFCHDDYDDFYVLWF